MTATEGHEESAESVMEDELEELGLHRYGPGRRKKEAPMSSSTWANQEFRYGKRYQPSREERYLEEQRYRRR